MSNLQPVADEEERERHWVMECRITSFPIVKQEGPEHLELAAR